MTEAEANILHEFRPRDEVADQTDYVVAGCACGWEGDRYPEGTDAYAEAQFEYDRHVANVDEPEGLEGAG